MGSSKLGIIASSINKAVSDAMTLTTTSSSAAWSPHTVTNPGSTLTWVATGAVTDTQVADDPTFDLSTSGGGNTNMSVTDVSQVTDLRMWVSMNLTAFNAGGLSGVLTLYLYNNQITTLDVSACTVMTSFQIHNNTGLGTIDLSNNTALSILRVDNCGLTALDVSNNTLLTNLKCYSNSSISSLDVSNNTLLTNLDCYGTAITSLDLSPLTSLSTVNCNSCSSLTTLTAGGGALTSLTLWGCSSVTSLDISAETSMTLLYAFSCGLTTGITTAGASSILNNVRVHQNNFSAGATNQLLSDLVASGINSGSLYYRNNETGTGVTDRATLVSRGWAITNYAT